MVVVHRCGQRVDFTVPIMIVAKSFTKHPHMDSAPLRVAVDSLVLGRHLAQIVAVNAVRYLPNLAALLTYSMQCVLKIRCV